MINAAIEALERRADPSAAEPRGDETAETLGRLYTEVVGLIPYELAPAVPRAETRRRILAAVTGAAEGERTTETAGTAGTSPAVSAAAPVPAPETPPETAAAVSPVSEMPETREVRRMPP